MTTPSFTLEQALAAQQKLRSTLGLQDEIFPMEAFVGMVSDEIEQMRAAGHSDEDSARLVREVTGLDVTGADLTTHYAEPDRRRRGEG